MYRAQLYGLTLLFVQSSSATACETGATLLDHWKRRQRTAALFMGKRHRANAIENSVTSTSNVASLTLIKAIQRSNAALCRQGQVQGLRKPVHKVTRALNCPTAL